MLSSGTPCSLEKAASRLRLRATRFQPYASETDTGTNSVAAFVRHLWSLHRLLETIGQTEELSSLNAFTTHAQVTLSARGKFVTLSSTDADHFCLSVHDEANTVLNGDGAAIVAFVARHFAASTA